MFLIRILLPLLCLTVFIGAGKGFSQKKKPNIILIMADDLGWGDTGYNGNKIIKTPHLDQMAKDGLQFNRFYSASAVCSPTRASCLTGRNPHRTGIFFANKGILRKEEVTIPELLKEKGYISGHFGKWHLGTLTHKEKDANRGRVGNTKEYNPPAWHGYEEAFVTESKVPTWDPMKKPVREKGSKSFRPLEKGEEGKPYGTFYWDFNGNKVTDNLDGDDSRVIMDRVLPFIAKAKKEKKPFFSAIWFHTPHKPCVAGPKYHEMYKGQNTQMRNYAGCITAMDEQIGRLRAYLKEQGMDKNTMIWFCSDNGPEDKDAGITGGFKNRKRSLNEGGVRVPGLLVWGNHIKKKGETNFTAVTSDYLPTIVDICGISSKKVPYTLDGISLLPLIKGKAKSRKEAIGFALNNQLNYTSGDYKLYAQNATNKQYELYNIVKDPYETNNLAKEEPKRVEQMLADYKNWLKDVESSFSGKEYGDESLKKFPQKWESPFIPKKVKAKKKQKKQ